MESRTLEYKLILELVTLISHSIKVVKTALYSSGKKLIVILKLDWF